MSKEDVDLDKDEDLEDDSASGGDSGSDNSAPPKDAPADKGSGDKRVNDLMGKWQAEQARANQLQQQLDAAQGKSPAPDPKAKPADGSDSANADEFLSFAREDARRRLFESEPKLAGLGLDQSAIVGSTLGEMQASLKRQKALVEGMESRVRGNVLKEHGLDPEVVAGAREEAHGVGQMSDDEFAAFLQKRDANRFD